MHVLYAIGGYLGFMVFPEFAKNEQYTPFGFGTIPQQPETFPTTCVVNAIVIIGIGGVALLIYFVKVKKTTGKT